MNNHEQTYQLPRPISEMDYVVEGDSDFDVDDLEKAFVRLMTRYPRLHLTVQREEADYIVIEFPYIFTSTSKPNSKLRKCEMILVDIFYDGFDDELDPAGGYGLASHI